MDMTTRQKPDLSSVFLILATCIHLLMIASLISEPFKLEPGISLEGSATHPVERHAIRGYLDAFFHDTDRVPRGLDFFSIYQAGRNFLRGQSVYYGVRVHDLGPEALVVPYFSGFRYLPAYAFVFGSLLNLLPPWPSYWSWIAIVELMMMFNLTALRRLPISTRMLRTIAAMWLIFSPFYIELHIGQQSMVTVTLIHLAIIAHMRGSIGLRDTCYAGSVLWKINTVLYIPVWIKLKRWKTLILLAVLTLITSVPYFLSIPGSFPEFRSYFRHKFVAAGPNSLGFSTLLIQFLQHAELDPETSRLLLNLCKLTIIVIAAAATLLPRKICFSHALMMWICVFFLTYQYVWEHHYVMILPLISAGMVDQKLRNWTIMVWFFCAVPTPYILLNNPSIPMPQHQWSLSLAAFYHGTKVLPIFVFFCRLVRESFTGNQTGSPDQSIIEDQMDVAGIFRRVLTSRKI